MQSTPRSLPIHAVDSPPVARQPAPRVTVTPPSNRPLRSVSR